MPGYRTHVTGAIVSAAATLVITHWRMPIAALLTSNNIACLAAGACGGLFPDIDIKSKGQKLWYSAIVPLWGAALVMRHTVFICVLSVLAVIPPLLPHRGITHELWFILLAPLGGPFLVSVYQPAYLSFAIDLYFFFVIGAISHLVLDLGPLGTLRRSLPRGAARKKRR